MGKAPKVHQRIPSMSLFEINQLWRNCINLLAKASTSPEMKSQARSTLDIIQSEWIYRASGKLRPGDVFDWPSTNALGGDGNLNAAEWQKDGILGFMGYHVGNTNGVVTEVRRLILREVFLGELPPAFPPYYMAQWGKPESIIRLQKMAETIAAHTRNAKRRRSSSVRAAVQSWEEDLEFLYFEFYFGRFTFGWPDTDVLDIY